MKTNISFPNIIIRKICGLFTAYLSVINSTIRRIFTNKQYFTAKFRTIRKKDEQFTVVHLFLSNLPFYSNL